MSLHRLFQPLFVPRLHTLTGPTLRKDGGKFVPIPVGITH